MTAVSTQSLSLSLVKEMGKKMTQIPWFLKSSETEPRALPLLLTLGRMAARDTDADRSNLITVT